MRESLPYYLGCSGWTCPDWIGSVFHKQTDPNDLLREYARIFNAVETGALFYALPPLSTVERWMAETRDGFKFAPTFPKAISHERRLVGSEEETKSFLKILE